MGKRNGLMSVLATISAGAAVYSFYQNHQPKRMNASNVLKSVLSHQKQ